MFKEMAISNQKTQIVDDTTSHTICENHIVWDPNKFSVFGSEERKSLGTNNGSTPAARARET